MTDDDDLADKYLAADEALRGAGLGWYEVSNWARTAQAACRHNQLLLDRRRLVGRRTRSALPRRRRALVERQAPDAVRRAGRPRSQPRRTAARCWTPSTRRVERVLLETRLRQGLPVDVLDDAGRAALPVQVERGLVEPDDVERGRVVLTTRGRLLADAVVRDLLS